MATMRLKVFSFAVAQPSAWHSRSMRCLVVAGDGAHGRACAGDHLIDERVFGLRLRSAHSRLIPVFTYQFVQSTAQ